MSIDDHPGRCLSCGEPAEDTDLFYCATCFDALPDPFAPRRYVLTEEGAATFRRMMDDPSPPPQALVDLFKEAL